MKGVGVGGGGGRRKSFHKTKSAEGRLSLTQEVREDRLLPRRGEKRSKVPLQLGERKEEILKPG